MVFLLELLVDERRRAKDKHRRLDLDEVLNEHRAEDELEKDKGQVDRAADALVRQEPRLGHWQDAQRQGEKDGKDLERNQLGEGLVDVAFVAEAETEVFDGDPEEETCSVDVGLVVRLVGLQAVDLPQQHHEDVDQLVSTVIEQQLLKVQ